MNILQKRIMVGCVLLYLASAIFAQTPLLLNYQGRLTDLGGAPLSGTYNMTFNIYDVSAGGAAFWSETQNSISVSDGLFEVLLGSSNPLHDSVFDGSARYVGLSVNAAPELAPRTQLASNAYSFRTSTIDGASGGNISSNMTVAGTVYSTTGGFRFPDGSIQSTASAGGGSGGQQFSDLFLYTTRVSVSPTTLLSPAGPESIYITGIYVSDPDLIENHNYNTGYWVLQFVLNSDTLFSLSPVISHNVWNSCGGAPIKVSPGDELVVHGQSLSQNQRVTITGYEF